MTQQQETEYAAKLRELTPVDLVAELEINVEELAFAPAPSSRMDFVRLARREIVRRLAS